MREGGVKPLGRLQLEGHVLSEAKALAIIVVTAELARLAGAEAAALFGRELRSAVAQVTDAEFVFIVTDGISPISSSGNTIAAVRTDLRAMLAAVNTDANSRLFLLVEASIAKIWSMLGGEDGFAFPGMTPQGGMIAGMPVIVSDGLLSGTAVLLDANQIAAGAGTIGLGATTQADLQTDSAPDSPMTTNTTLVSLWQSDLVGLKAERYFGAERLRDTAVAVLEGINCGDSP